MPDVSNYNIIIGGGGGEQRGLGGPILYNM
jgi:hypothetical protein